MSRVVVLDLSRHNTVLAGHDRHFVLQVPGSPGRITLVRDRCPHRGGPLSLARLTQDSRRLTCPWHGTRVAVSALCRTSSPMVRTGQEAIAVLPDVPADVPVSLVWRRILANQAPSQAPADPAMAPRHG